MGVWSYIHGNVSLPKKEHVSIEKAVRCYFRQSEKFKLTKITENEHYHFVHISFNVDESGCSVADNLQLLLTSLDGLGCKYDLEVSLRYLN